MIRNISQEEVFDLFFDLIIDIEMGDHFDKTNESHLKWLEQKVSRRFGCGAIFYGYFDTDKAPIGIGSVVIEDHPIFQGYSELLDLGVIPKFRGLGYGTKLVQHAEHLSRDAGLFCMYISTYAGDEIAISFYTKCGYTPVAVLPDVNGPKDEGKLYLRKRLYRDRE
ncbi:MAG: GNAT family N-acetyltransferase [Desulfobacteraceae bacterium]|nr:GNAT family N-acetyltransferase [Desulfobacteraceae bacterium]MBU4055364.1 GNAT family N-acetyltransferase [Pseudomonadota bacterium]